MDIADLNHVTGSYGPIAVEQLRARSQRLGRGGLGRRKADERDARGVRLYPMPLSQENRRRLQQAWRQELAGTIDDPKTMATMNAALRLIEEWLTARARGR